MSKSNFWIFNILILIGLFFLFSAISSLIPSFFAIFGILFLAAGIYIGFKPTGTSRKEEILDSREIPVEINQSKPIGVLKKEQTLNNQEVLAVDDQNKSTEVSENSDNPIRQSKALAIKMKIKEIEDNKEEAEEEIEEERNESFGGKINNIQGWGNKTPRKDLALIVGGIFLLLISSLVSGVSSISAIFVYLGTLFVGVGLYLILKRVLTVEQVIDNWGIMIKEGNGKAEEIFILAEAFMIASKAPSLKIHRAEMSPGIIRGILGTSRNFLVATDKNFRLNPYKIFINARDYGNNLDVSWYLTYRLPFWRALLRFIPFIGGASFALESLDVFDRQDLTAYTTVCHYSILDAVGKIMMILNQDPSRIDRKSRGFLGIA
jgi:protein-S-isoprenylcysteine O-methyltransferase Ste14